MVDNVTVYRGQALVTRVLPIGGAAGLREIVLTDLPEQIIPGSLFAEGGAEVALGNLSAAAGDRA
jgi:hypothetical protein